jgi:hypothetical protein
MRLETWEKIMNSHQLELDIEKPDLSKWRQQWLFTEFAPKIVTMEGGWELEFYSQPIEARSRKLKCTWTVETDQELVQVYQSAQEYYEPVIWAPYLPLYTTNTLSFPYQTYFGFWCDFQESEPKEYVQYDLGFERGDWLKLGPSLLKQNIDGLVERMCLELLTEIKNEIAENLGIPRNILDRIEREIE